MRNDEGRLRRKAEGEGGRNFAREIHQVIFYCEIPSIAPTVVWASRFFMGEACMGRCDIRGFCNLALGAAGIFATEITEDTEGKEDGKSKKEDGRKARRYRSPTPKPFRHLPSDISHFLAALGALCVLCGYF